MTTENRKLYDAGYNNFSSGKTPPRSCEQNCVQYAKWKKKKWRSFRFYPSNRALKHYNNISCARKLLPRKIQASSGNVDFPPPQVPSVFLAGRQVTTTALTDLVTENPLTIRAMILVISAVMARQLRSPHENSGSYAVLTLARSWNNSHRRNGIDRQA